MDHALEPGQRVFGRYTLEERLGLPGPVAVVWRARTDDGFTYALKFPGPAVETGPAWRAELEPVVATCAHLTDRAVVTPLQLLEEGPLLAVATDHVPHASVAELLARQPGRTFAPDDLHWLLHQLCRTLDRLANHPGYPHGDLRPSNFVPAPHDEFRLLDYRVSAIFRRACTTAQLAPAQQKRFFSNRSPQLVARQPLTPADDIYALGASVYELLTGEPPFFTGNILHDLQNERVPEMGRRRDELGHPHPELPTHWEETVAACLAKEPGQRPVNPTEVLQRLQIDATARCPWPVPAAPTPAPTTVFVPVPSRSPPPLPAPALPPPVQTQPAREPRARNGCRITCLMMVAALVILIPLCRQLPGPPPGRPVPPRLLKVPGAYRSIQRAIDAASAGAVVRIDNGTYAENLRLKDGVSLESASNGQGKVVLRAAPSARNMPVVTGSDLAGVRLTGLDFEGPGAARTDANLPAVVALRGCEATFQHCRVLRGAHDGLAVEGGSIRLQHCVFFGCGNDGARVEGPLRAPVDIAASEFGRNGANGLLVIGPAGGEVTDDTFEGNSSCGLVIVGARASPNGTNLVLSKNKSRLNGQSGFYFGRGALGQANDNLAEHNAQQGFVFSDRGTAPTLHRNVSAANGGFGFAFKNGAAVLPLTDNAAAKNELGETSR